MTPGKPRRLEPRACLSRCQARLGRSSAREPLPAWAAAAGSVLAPAALSYTRRHQVRSRFHVTPLAARYCSSRDGGCGAGDGVRTRDLLLGKQTLCQLSYSRSGGLGVHPVRRGMYHPADDTAPLCMDREDVSVRNHVRRVYVALLDEPRRLDHTRCTIQTRPPPRSRRTTAHTSTGNTSISRHEFAHDHPDAQCRATPRRGPCGEASG